MTNWRIAKVLIKNIAMRANKLWTINTSNCASIIQHTLKIKIELFGSLRLCVFKWVIQGLFVFIFVFSTANSKQMFNIKVCQWMDSNHWPLSLEATALPTKSQPLPSVFTYTNVAAMTSYGCLIPTNLNNSSKQIFKLKLRQKLLLSLRLWLCSVRPDIGINSCPKFSKSIHSSVTLPMFLKMVLNVKK